MRRRVVSGLVLAAAAAVAAGASARYVARLARLEDGRLVAGPKVELPPASAGGRTNPVPGGLCFTRDGKRLFVAACNLHAVVEIDPAAGTVVRQLPVQLLPFEVRLSEDERTLI